MLPWGRDMRTAVFLASVLVGLVGTTAARAQVFDLDADRMPVVELKGLWRFHTGDDSVLVSNGASGAGQKVRTETRVKNKE